MPLFSKKAPKINLEGLPLEEYLHIAETEEDPVIIHEALTRAEALAPEDMNIQMKLLLLGRLHERKPNRFDFHVIKCYLLHAFEHPDAHSEEERTRMIREIFDYERLKRCLETAPDPERFLGTTYWALPGLYAPVRGRGQQPCTAHLRLHLQGRLPKYLAVPARDILDAIFSSPLLSEEEAKALGKAFYRAFYDYTNGEVKELDKNLGPQLRALLR